MSVIYKTLKKLKTESADKKNSKNKSTVSRRIHFLKKELYSRSNVLLLLLMLTVIGTGTLYGYYHLRETKAGTIKGFDIPNTDMQRTTDTDKIENLEDKNIESLDRTKHSESSRVEYSPPQSDNNRLEVYTSNEPDNVEVPFVTGKEPLPKPRKTIKSNAVNKIKKENENKHLDEKVPPAPNVEKIFLTNAKKNAEIARLVANIRWEMEHGDDKRIEKLFDELSVLKGKNNSYFLKLKAVWYIHKEEFERAKDLLHIVLTKNEIDQEAGINMAIIEINSNQMESAYQRLNKLQMLYPENIRIAEILRDLKLLFKRARN